MSVDRQFRNRAPSGSGWTAYTPAVSAETGSMTTTSAVGLWAEMGAGIILYHATITITTAGTGAGGLRFTTPWPIHADFKYLGTGYESAASGWQCSVARISSSTAEIHYHEFSSVITSGRVLSVSGFYKRG